MITTHQDDEHPLFSVCIPVYNRADLVARTIDSVLAQTLSTYEIVAVNDGSKDTSLDVLRTYEPRIRVIDQPNKGLAGARNTAAAHAVGRYLVFLDSDDLFFPWSLRTLADAIAASRHDINTDPAMVSGYFMPFDDEHELASVEPPTTPAIRTFPDYLSTRALSTGIAPSGTAIRRDLFHEVGGGEEVRVMFEDVELWFKLGGFPGYAHVDDPPVVAYRVGHAQMMGNMQKQLDGYAWLRTKVDAGQLPHPDRAHQMRDILAIHAKGCAVRCLHAKDRARGLAFYRRALPGLLRTGQLKFLAAYPVLLAVGRGVAAPAMRERKKQTVSDE
ncbi:MAG: glycosyltransferase family 2 protein [Planctomycetota bacterium]